MKRALLFLLFLTSPVAGQDAGFTPLFNGKNLDGWQARGGGKLDSWSVQEGILTAKAGGGWLGTTQSYDNYILRVTWRLPKNGNSGVFLRVPELDSKVSPSQTAMEIQILDDTGPAYLGKLKKWQYSGSLYGFMEPSKAVYRPGEWNRFEITCADQHVAVVFNDVKIVDADLAQFPALTKRPTRGLVGLQNHGSAVEFREVLIKPLPK